MFVQNNNCFFKFLFVFFCFSLFSEAANTAETNTAEKKNRCSAAFFSADQINSIHDLAEAVSKGLILTPKQTTLWRIYQNTFFPEPSNTGSGIQEVFSTLKQHPELSKPSFREYHLSFQSRRHQTPPELSDYVSQFKQTQARLRGPFVSPTEQLPFWSKVLNIRAEDRKVQSLKTMEKLEALFGRKLLHKKPKEWTEGDIIELYNRLHEEREAQRDRGEDIYRLSKAMLDLIHTSWFIQHSRSDRMKNTDPVVVLQALRQTLEDREHVSSQLGFKSFERLQSSLNLKGVDESFYSLVPLSEKLNDLEAKVKAIGVVKSPVHKPYRIRALSLIESPFRGCMGGSDCSSDHYFKKGLDPNYIYWTKTDQKFRSSGHVTTVLGVARRNGEDIKVAFVDKIQDISPEELIPFLLAINKSLREESYVLGFPLSVGDHNGLSNTEGVRDYVESRILPSLKKDLGSFSPHVHEYHFDGGYSRANEGLRLREFDIESLEGVEVRAGVKRDFYTLEGLTESGFREGVFQLRERDVDTFINNIIHFQELNIFGLSEVKVRGILMDLLREYSGSSGLSVRKRVFYELIGLRSSLFLSDFFQILGQFFTERERGVLVGEMSNWRDSTKKGRGSFFRLLELAYYLDYPGMEIFKKVFKGERKALETDDFFFVARRGDTGLLRIFFERGSDVNAKNSYRNTALHSAAMGGHTEAMKLLIERGADVNAENSYGTTALHLAAGEGHTKAMKLLIERGADVNAKNSFGNIALHVAAEKGHTEAMKLLTERGSDVNAKKR